MQSEAQKLIDSVEQDIQRMRIDEALKASLVARLDELRGMNNQPESVHEVYSRTDCRFNYCAAPNLCKRSNKCVNC